MGDRMGNTISRPSTDTHKILVFSCNCSECHEVTLPLHFFMNVFSRSPTPVVVSVAFNVNVLILQEMREMTPSLAAQMWAHCAGS
ncbi:uncharacterized protein LACBIDRAFT_298170 [Laccaria bicolor S238N-H82]|uniref:Predicted protein n=1 Tax=Laccaria bicolor (strain S238N-H82 / ATCC MYA-4686) TaxID=486041 RepID=B0DCD9_LACBS|nr:uncharacterized protein LACBIDRAFT_298170 [Laccaria bicolor S238N-H82]EDR07882.1 predicted protein [Laccaria bicolor S238N-H82]|eukprot:XP_001881671.1 predicted protein [Laccaria bicolor S238N-H82]